MENLEFKGTPGPWHTRGNAPCCVADANEKAVIVVDIFKHDLATYQANARLIAAAPELLAALGNFLTIIECNPELLESPCFKAAHDYANEVIKKALEG